MDYQLNSVLHIWVVGSSGLSISLAKQCIAYLGGGSGGLSAKQCCKFGW